jgi:hypothetical protein
VRRERKGSVEPFPAVSACRLASYLETFRVIDARQAEENPPALNSIKSGFGCNTSQLPPNPGKSSRKSHMLVMRAASSVIVPEDGRNAIIVSLTHVRMHNSPPFATAVFDYQKHRVKKLKKQNKT